VSSIECLRHVTNESEGLGSVVVFCATLFSLWAGVESGYAAVIIVQAGVFAEASRQLIKYVMS